MQLGGGEDASFFVEEAVVAGDVDGVRGRVFFDDVPRTVAESESFALACCVEPVSLVGS